MDDDDHTPTPPRGAPLTLTESERWRRAHGVPVSAFREASGRADQLIDALTGGPRSRREEQIVQHLRELSLDPGSMLTVIAGLAAYIERQQEDSDQQRSADIEKLQRLLDKPPNGAVAQLQAQSSAQQVQLTAQRGQIDLLLKEVEALQSADRTTDATLEEINKVVAPVRKSATWALRGAGAVFLMAAAWLWSAGGDVREAKYRLEQVEKAREEAKERYEQLRQQFEMFRVYFYERFNKGNNS